MCPEEQQTSDNLIVKGNCFIIEIFDKWIFTSLLKSFKLSIERIDNCLCEINYNSWQ